MNLESKKKYDSIRIFKNPFLEWCTHVHPIVPLVLWGPIALYLLINGASANGWDWRVIASWFVLGVVVWTLLEYLLHRFLFHFEAKSSTGKYLVYLFHGLHHDDPNDPTRLVFPPVPAIAIVSLFYFVFSLIIPAQGLHLFMSAFLIGYLCYDYIHFATHHFKMNSRLGRILKKNHLQHHNLHGPYKYGVSSPLWDYVFRTFYTPKEKSRFDQKATK